MCHWKPRNGHIPDLKTKQLQNMSRILMGSFLFFSLSLSLVFLYAENVGIHICPNHASKQVCNCELSVVTYIYRLISVLRTQYLSLSVLFLMLSNVKMQQNRAAQMRKHQTWQFKRMTVHNTRTIQACAGGPTCITKVSVVTDLSLIHIWRCRRTLRCRSRWSPYH